MNGNFQPEEYSKRAVEILRLKGFEHSAKHKLALDGKGDPLPWFSYPAIDFLAGLDFSDKAIFEFGAGCSTLFWARVAKSIYSVENDKAWYHKIARAVPSNCTIVLRSDQKPYLDWIFFSRKVGPGGAVLAFEPQRLVFKLFVPILH